MSDHHKAREFCDIRSALPAPHRPDGTCSAPHRDESIFMATDCFYCAARTIAIREMGYEVGDSMFPRRESFKEEIEL